MMQKHIETYYQRYATLSDVGSHSGAIFGSSWGGPPRTDFVFPWGTLSQTFSNCLKIVRVILLQLSKILEQHFDTS